MAKLRVPRNMHCGPADDARFMVGSDWFVLAVRLPDEASGARSYILWEPCGTHAVRVYDGTSVEGLIRGPHEQVPIAEFRKLLSERTRTRVK